MVPNSAIHQFKVRGGKALSARNKFGEFIQKVELMRLKPGPDYLHSCRDFLESVRPDLNAIAKSAQDQFEEDHFILASYLRIVNNAGSFLPDGTESLDDLKNKYLMFCKPLDELIDWQKAVTRQAA